MIMNIYECEISLHENTFFSSREINNFYQTEALLGNYALSYAFGFISSPYNNNKILYKQHLTSLNDRDIYITPAKVVGKPKYAISQFNATSETYWSKVEQNAISTDINVKIGKSKGARAANIPQIGRIKMLAIGSIFRCYIISKNELEIPQYIRLGKFMSKAKVETTKIDYKISVEQESFVCNILLNPVDLSDDSKLSVYDLFSVHPVPLIDNARIISKTYQLNNGLKLPYNMHFGVAGLTA